MPPPEAGSALDDDEVDVLRRWLAGGSDLGAPLGLRTAEKRDAAGPPALRTLGPIDRFVAARLREEGLDLNGPDPP